MAEKKEKKKTTRRRKQQAAAESRGLGATQLIADRFVPRLYSVV